MKIELADSVHLSTAQYEYVYPIPRVRLLLQSPPERRFRSQGGRGKP